jgi:hypothetical protein
MSENKYVVGREKNKHIWGEAAGGVIPLSLSEAKNVIRSMWSKGKKSFIYKLVKVK